MKNLKITNEIEIVNFLEDLTYSLTELDGDLIAFADLGLWNGRRTGYKELSTTLSHLGNFLLGLEGTPVSLDLTNDLTYTYAHHDGYNTVTIRRFRKNVSDNTVQKVLDSIYDQEENAFDKFLKNTISIKKQVLTKKLKLVLNNLLNLKEGFI